MTYCKPTKFSLIFFSFPGFPCFYSSLFSHTLFNLLFFINFYLHTHTHIIIFFLTSHSDFLFSFSLSLFFLYSLPLYLSHSCLFSFITFFFIEYIDDDCATSTKPWGSPRDIVAKVLDCNILVRKFKLQSHHYIHFRANILIPPSYELNKITTVLLQRWLWN